ncbi:DUF1848 family protein [bacterium]|nr:DUF1848 family protein [bacterium]
MNWWMDFTRRNDPAHPAGLVQLQRQLADNSYPHILCFWTKAPAILSEMYFDTIVDMQKEDVLVLAQVTINNYFAPMEPNITPAMIDLTQLVRLIGSDSIRIRFDPIIVGYTTPAHFKQTVAIATKHNIKRIVTKFLIPEYKGVGKLLQQQGFNIEQPTLSHQTEILARLLNVATDAGVELAVCAETANLIQELPKLKPAACADPDWATALRPDFHGLLQHRPSRPGCGCVYSGDWGEYRSRGGYTCPHQCLYCYAK